MTTPIFLFSLPRSGSTLLQRMIARHPAVATTSEPWFLLPIFLGFREGEVFATYRQRPLSQAFEDFLSALPEGQARYRSAVRGFAGSLYGGACRDGESHFLDKTPRYHLIAEEIVSTFPDARYLLLWRNPLAVAASCVETWARGRWDLHRFELDLFQGAANLVDLQKSCGDQLLVLSYEELVADPEVHMARIFEHCGLAPIQDAAEKFAQVVLDGRMGDPNRMKLEAVSSAFVDKWVSSFRSPSRRAWARRYLRWLGAERLKAMGYSADHLLGRLEAESADWLAAMPDLFWAAYSEFAKVFERDLFAQRRRLRRRRVGSGATLE